jgi:2-C-methyl-D-erythritol 4-phosphate cytidylyltransferase
MMIVALIVAAGSGERLGASQPKALVELAGRPLLQWSIDALGQVSAIEQIVVAMPPGAHPALGVEPVAGMLFVDGGASRSESVHKALAAALPATGSDDLVLVHDAARPLLTPALAETVIAALQHDPDAQAAIAAMPVTDTVKRVDVAGAVRETLDRSELWAVQTPQVFRRGALEQALAAGPDELAQATDDAWLIERGGGKVLVVNASDENLKVTTPLDLRLAELLLGERSTFTSAQRKSS